MKRSPQPDPARAALDRQREALRETLRYVADASQRRVFIGALRATEQALGVRRAVVRKERV